jgi:hypothetical protein
MNDRRIAFVAATSHVPEVLCRSTMERDMSGKGEALKARIEQKLDQALEDTFPASDPVAFIMPAPANGGDRKLPVVEAADDARKSRTRKSRATRS